MLEMLQPFCASRADVREYMRAPLRAGDDAVGTNGHVAVALFGAAHLVPAAALAHDGLQGALAKLKAQWTAVPAEAWRPFADIERPHNPKKRSCHACEGKKFVLREECCDCDGEGGFQHGSHTYECKACDGHGETEESCAEGREGAEPCGMCDNRGWKFEDHFVFCKVPGMPDGSGLREMYVEKLATIDGLEWAYVPGGAVQGVAQPVYLRFSGGWGLAMPTRV